MDFFEHQDVARKQTGRLILLFILSVLGIVFSVYLATVFILVGVEAKTGSSGVNFSTLVKPDLLLLVAAAVLVVVTLGSLYKVSQLSAGGTVVAENVGGRPLDRASADAEEKRLLNVVEEMAIAAGTAVPPVYLMDNEEGINAFAAGYSPNDAVIGVTRGCIQKLSRDQLQGVIAHEFSHILNGDMRLNIRVMGVIHGILVIGLIGWFVLQSAMYSSHGRTRQRGKQDNPLPIILFGAALMVIGYIGTFFGNLIKSAVSRQREFLADASAVQYTRNPDTIAGALKMIGGLTNGSKIDNPRGQEISHMFFGQSHVSMLNALFATHPPLIERIHRIDPSFDGQLTTLEESADPQPPFHGNRRSAALAGLTGDHPVAASQVTGDDALPVVTGVVAHIGQPTKAHLAYVRKLMDNLPRSIVQAGHEPYGARALIYALLLNQDREPRTLQFERLKASADPAVFDETRKLSQIVDQLDVHARLPVIDIAIGSLRKLSRAQYAAFKDNVDALIRCDDQIDLFEWVISQIILHHLEPNFSGQRPTKIKYHSLEPLADHCSVLLSTLAYAGHDNDDEADHAFGQGAMQLEGISLQMRSRQQCGLRALDRALDALATAAPTCKRQLLNAVATCIAADKTVTLNEGELLRAIADTLDCPTPPMLPGQPLI